MAITLSKNLKQKQNIKLTPSLRKSIDLLQLSRFELIKKIEKHIDENPFLEKDDGLINSSESYDQAFDFEIESKLSLRETLIKQLNDFKINKKETEISKLIIDCIDESGQLVTDIEEIEEISNFLFTENEIEESLIKIIHRMKPYGIGFRDHKECIKIQIDNSKLSKQKKFLIGEILSNEKMDDIKEIKDSLIQNGHSEKAFKEALYEIKNCDLSPGLNFAKTDFISADLKILIKDKDKNMKIDFIEESFPLIKLDDQLIDNIKKELKSKKNKEILEKINEAKWLLSSVKKRNDTVLKVGEFICSKQIAFFEDNPLKIKTLTNKDIAEEVGFHPSTISRILKHKYIDTPKGLMPLKSLLVSSVSKTRHISSIQLMKIIEDIISSEKKPKSDRQISIELNKKGFNLARRTISKYRKKNNIPSSRYR
tara:strand:- start:324 stop:1598 length:1275 start_codon:yes stop_codon:yes gene_type:complete